MIVAWILAAALGAETWKTECGAGIFLPQVGGYWIETGACHAD